MAKKLPLITNFDNIPEAALVPEEEQPYEIPEHWKWVRLGVLLDYVQRGKGPKYADAKTGYLAISQKCVRWEGLDLTQARPWSADSFQKLNDVRLLREQDLLWNSTGTGTIGRIVAVPPIPENLRGRLAADSHVTVMRTTELLNSTYLLQYISSEHTQGQVEEHLASGSTNQKELGLAAIKGLPTPLPPLEEQQRIVEYIEQTNSKIDDVIQRLEQYIEQAPSERNKIIEAAMRGLLTKDWRETNDSALDSQSTDIDPAAFVPKEEQPYEIPEHWKWVRLGSVLDYVQRGKGPKYAVSKTGYLAVSQKCVRWEGLDLTQARPWDPDSFRKLSQIRLVQEGDLLWNSTGTGTIGRVALVPPLQEELCGKLAADSHVTVMRTARLLDSSYLFYFISSTHIQSQVEERLATGTTNQKELGLATINGLQIPLPPLEEQQRIVEKLNRCIEKIDLAIEHAKEARANVENLRQALTTAALAGHIPAK